MTFEEELIERYGSRIRIIKEGQSRPQFRGVVIQLNSEKEEARIIRRQSSGPWQAYDWFWPLIDQEFASLNIQHRQALDYGLLLVSKHAGSAIRVGTPYSVTTHRPYWKGWIIFKAWEENRPPMLREWTKTNRLKLHASGCYAWNVYIKLDVCIAYYAGPGASSQISYGYNTGWVNVDALFSTLADHTRLIELKQWRAQEIHDVEGIIVPGLELEAERHRQIELRYEIAKKNFLDSQNALLQNGFLKSEIAKSKTPE